MPGTERGPYDRPPIIPPAPPDEEVKVIEVAPVEPILPTPEKEGDDNA